MNFILSRGKVLKVSRYTRSETNIKAEVKGGRNVTSV